MDTFLDVIRDEKHRDVSDRKKLVGEQSLREKLESLSPSLDFVNALSRRQQNSAGLTAPGLIAEVKLKAPGIQNIDDLDLNSLLTSYRKGGATAISVLTDNKHFGGSLDLLKQARLKTSLPILQKEFIVDPYQLLEGRIAGADAALLLVHYFSKADLQEMIDYALEIGITPVVECSKDDEVDRAIATNPQVVLLNNRPISSIPANPKETYSMGSVENSHLFWDRHASIRDWKKQNNRKLISASCIANSDDVSLIMEKPYDAILVGNAAASSSDPEIFLKKLYNR